MNINHPIRVLGLFLAAAFGLSACSTDIDLYNDDTVNELFVWACLDGSGGPQQVKIRKAIAEEDLLNEAIKDPAHYLPPNPLEVSLSQGASQPFLLQPVLYPAQTGIFAEDSNLIYETAGFRPRFGESVNLTITDLVTGNKVTSSVDPLPAPRFTYPVPGSVNARYSFTDKLRPFQINWSGGDCWIWSISIKYLDVLLTGDTIHRKGTFYGETKYSNPSREFPVDYLWNIFRKVIPVDRDVDYRMFYRFDFGVVAGDYHLANYLQNTAKFKDKRRERFCNMTGGTGLFYSVNHTELKNIKTYDIFGYYLHTTDTLLPLRFSEFFFTGFYKDPDSVRLVNSE
jgi:hypothetical protein